jgi:hypothetical protein
MNMSKVLEFNDAVERVVNGKPVAEITQEMIAPPEGNRNDDSDEEIAAGFRKIISDFEGRYPYIDAGWVNRISDELKTGADLAVIRAAAEQNRGQYAGSHRIDAGGNFDTWDAIFRALDAQYEAPKP